VAAPRIAVGPQAPDFAVQAVKEGGGQVVDAGQPADGLVWISPRHLDQLRSALDADPGLRWVQLPFAGVENHVADGLIDEDHVWTCAKGSYARPVAEHALMLALAGLRMLPDRIRATSWGREGGRSLYGAPVTILGGGGITEELLRLLAPFGVEATVLRRRPEPLAGAARVLGADQVDLAIEGATVVFVALALTPETRHVINRSRLRLMGPETWLVNVARGGHVDTDALVSALQAGEIGGAGLDVTEPEPLPDGHPLWSAPNCIITPHTADTSDMVVPLLAERIRTNVARFAAGEPLVGVVDPRAGY
jgi:phosphoglycerate dehydrogenase-like enzyme